MNKLYKYADIAESVLGFPGTMIWFSKTDYMDKNPDHVVVFNANVCTEEGKIWFGDLDITLSQTKLMKLADKLGVTVYVLYEMDGRFENEDKPLLDRYVAKFNPGGTVTIKW